MNSVMTAMTNEMLAAAAPSIMADHADPGVSRQYKQVRTIDVVDLMRGEGWMPVRARQLNVRKDERVGFCKHEIRFQREGDTSLSKMGDETIQAVLTNSHDRSSVFHFMLGVFRLACSNGLVVAQGMFNEIKVRHVGFDPAEIGDAARRMAEGGQLVAGHIGAMREAILNRDEQMALAKSASVLLFDPAKLEDGSVDFHEENLLTPRREADKGDDLWRTFNRVQENVTRGGLRYHRVTPSDAFVGAAHAARARTHAIKSIDRDIRLNQALWTLAEEMLKIKSA